MNSRRKPPVIILKLDDLSQQNGAIVPNFVTMAKLLEERKITAYHEMGHVVGLRHPTLSGRVMSSTPAGLPWKSDDLTGFSVLKAAH